MDPSEPLFFHFSSFFFFFFFSFLFSGYFFLPKIFFLGFISIDVFQSIEMMISNAETMMST